MTAKILELMELNSRLIRAREAKEAADRLEREAAKSYYAHLLTLINGGAVKVDQVYMVGGEAVIFRKTRRDDSQSSSYHDNPQYDYSYEVLPVS